jgi:NADH-quinone oxidoreductase subunit G
MHKRLGPGMLEVPEESNGRGLREVGCLPGAGPGLSAADGSGGADSIKAGLQGGELDTLLLLNSDPVRTHPDSEGWGEALSRSFVVSVAMFDDESTKHANLVFPAESYAEKEGTVTHPDGRLQRVRRNVPLPEHLQPTWWLLAQVLGDDSFATAEDVFAAVCGEVAFYGPTTYEEIGGRGLRWQDRDPGSSWTPDAAPATPDSTPPAPEPAEDGLVLGTYRDLWANEVTVRNPALRFLMPTQKLELASKDAERLELEHGDPVTVSVNGSSVEARVAVKERMREGAAFLIEGTTEQNGNVLANGVPQRIAVAKREETASQNGSRARVVETPIPGGRGPR